MVEESFDPIVIQSETENYVPIEVIPEKRPVMALVAGLGASLVGSLIWVFLVSLINNRWGAIIGSLLIGMFVGHMVKTYGRGNSLLFGVIGALFAALALGMGDLWVIVSAASRQEGVSPIAALVLMVGNSNRLLNIVFQALTNEQLIVFTLLAIGEGFWIPFRVTYRPRKPKIA